MWVASTCLFAFAIVNNIIDGKQKEAAIVLVITLLSIAFFFFYRHTSRILKEYSVEQAESFTFLKYVNPVAPIIYITTILLAIAIILNIVMGVFFVIGLLLYVLGIIVTIGLVLLKDSYKLETFVSIPKKFFKAEDYLFNNIVGPEYIIAYLVLVYFVVPIGSSVFIIINHYSKKEAK